MTISEQFIGTDIEGQQPVRSDVIYTTELRSNTDRSRAEFWRRLNASLSAEYAREAAAERSKHVKADGFEVYVCPSCGKKAYRKDPSTKTCRPCRRRGATS